MTTVADLLSVAMILRAEERAEVAHQLLLSLEPFESDGSVDEAWASEISRRLQAIREGRTELRDWHDVLADIRQSLVAQDRE